MWRRGTAWRPQPGSGRGDEKAHYVANFPVYACCSCLLGHTPAMARSIQSLGGQARARRLTQQQRRRIARQAARARWKDPRKVLADHALLEAFCRKYKLRGLYAFGSILTPSFTKTSDVDLLYVPEKDLSESGLDYLTYSNAVEELSEMLGRNVDFIHRRLIEQSENEFRRQAILSSARPIYEAPQ